MKKIIHRTFALMLACVLLAALALSASAAELDLTSDAMPIELENGPDAGYVTGTRISGLPFTMTAANVTSFLSSMASGKGFLPTNYAGRTIRVNGTLYHSITNGNIRSGICYYNASQGIYIPGVYRNTLSGQYITMSTSASSLIQGMTYYGYIRNDAGGGAVNGGSITVSAS